MTPTTAGLAELPADEQRRRAREMARTEPDLTAADLAARFGKSDRWARTQRSAAHATGTHQRNVTGTSAPPERTIPETGTPATIPDPTERNVESIEAHSVPAAGPDGARPVVGGTLTGTGAVPEQNPAFRPDPPNAAPEPTNRGHQSPLEASPSASPAATPTSDPAGARGASTAATAPPAGTTTEPDPVVPARWNGTDSTTEPQPETRPPSGTTQSVPARIQRAGNPATPAGTAQRPERNSPAGVADADPLLLSGLILLAMAAAMAWSWQHLAHLAVMAGATHGEFDIGPGMQWLLPISVDVLLVAGAWKARRLHTTGRHPGGATWTALTGAALMSLGGNVLSTLDMAGLTPPIDQWDPVFAVAVVVTVGLWMPAAAIVALEVLRDQGRPAARNPKETTTP